MTKVQLYVMLVLHNVRKIPSNVMFWKPEIAGCLLMGTVPPQKKRGYARITHIYIDTLTKIYNLFRIFF